MTIHRQVSANRTTASLSTFFTSPFINETRDVASALLSHRNPYTDRKYADDPAVAIIEVNNENSMLELLNVPELEEALTPPFADALRTRWVNWLRSRYGTTDALRAAWGAGDGAVIDSLIADPGVSEVATDQDARCWRDHLGWCIERHGPAQSTVESLDGGGARWEILAPGDVDWAHQINYRGVSLIADEAYVMTVRARAHQPTTLTLSVELDEGDYTPCGLWEQRAIGTEWQVIELPFIAENIGTYMRANLRASNQPGLVLEIDSVMLDQIDPLVLGDDETLEAGNIPFTGDALSYTAKRDFIQFLLETDRAYATEMAAFLRDTLDVKSLITVSQLNSGEMAAVGRETSASSLISTHAYDDHPVWKEGVPRWSPVDWTIDNRSPLVDPDGGALAKAALQHVDGFPFAIGEYSNPLPNDHAAVSFPLLSVLGAFQNWDLINGYTYKNYGVDYDRDFIGPVDPRYTDFFTMHSSPAHMAGLPTAALLFRADMIEPATDIVTLTATSERIIDDLVTNDIWHSTQRLWAEVDLSPRVAWQHGTRLEVVDGDQPARLDGSPSPLPPAGEAVQSVTGQLIWDSQAQTLLVNAPQARMLIGDVGGERLAIGDVIFDVDAIPGDMPGHLMLVALDDATIDHSNELLLTAISTAENQDMGWNPERTSVEDQWGSGPTVVRGLTAGVEIPGPSRYVYRWDASLQGWLLCRAVVDNGFQIQPMDQTVWWRLTGHPVGEPNAQRVQETYFAYYGRPADPEGRDFWRNRLDQTGGSLEEIIDDFGTSPEFEAEYGALGHEALVATIYEQMLCRQPDTAGRDFYLEQLRGGQMTLANITLAVLDGAQNEDVRTIENKLAVADYFTTRISQLGRGEDYGSEDIEAARSVLEGVCVDSQSVDEGLARAEEVLDRL